MHWDATDPVGVRSFRYFFVLEMHSCSGFLELECFVNLLSLCRKILNTILSTDARQAVVSYLSFSLRYVLGKATRRGRKWWFTTTSSGSISWLFNSYYIRLCCIRDDKYDMDPTTANGIISSVGGWRQPPALSSCYALTDHRCHTFSNDRTRSSEKCHQRVVFYIYFLYCSRHLLVTALPTGKEINENKEEFKKKLNPRTIKMIQLVSLPVYNQQRPPQWLMIQRYLMKSKIACLSFQNSASFSLWDLHCTVFFTFLLKVISVYSDRR